MRAFYIKYGGNAATDKYPNGIKGAAQLKNFGEALGTNGLPTVLTPKEFDQMVADGKFTTVTYRAVYPNPDLHMTAEQIIDDYRYNRDMYIGYGVYGNGTYTNPDAHGVASYYGNTYFRIGIDSNARIANSNTLYNEYTQFLTEARINLDMGEYALMRGYDAIYCEWGGHYNILNRTATYVVREDPFHFR